MKSKNIYHGSTQIIEKPQIFKTEYTKDFGWGFYCTNSYEQAERWAIRRDIRGFVNTYSYSVNSQLKIKSFDKMTDEWLDFIAACRKGKNHSFDIVEGPMADDTIWNYVNDFFAGNIDRQTFWEAAKFKHPTHQICFCTDKALNCIQFEKSEEIHV